MRMQHRNSTHPSSSRWTASRRPHQWHRPWSSSHPAPRGPGCAHWGGVLQVERPRQFAKRRPALRTSGMPSCSRARLCTLGPQPAGMQQAAVSVSGALLVWHNCAAEQCSTLPSLRCRPQHMQVDCKLPTAHSAAAGHGSQDTKELACLPVAASTISVSISKVSSSKDCREEGRAGRS